MLRCCNSMIVAVLLVHAGCFWSVPERFRETVEDPAGEFTACTQITFPSSAKIIAVGDTHGGFHGDGEFYLVFDADESEIAGWLDQPPPWNQPAWLTGPVPYEISGHCLADATSSESARNLFKATITRYIAEDFQQASIPWHNGHLLAIDIESGRVILSWWDF
mgnify:CR=1 FL=1